MPLQGSGPALAPRQKWIRQDRPPAARFADQVNDDTARTGASVVMTKFIRPTKVWRAIERLSRIRASREVCQVEPLLPVGMRCWTE